MTNKHEVSSGVEFFDADRPIRSVDEDKLGRRPFAEAIARQIRTVPAHHGFTLAIVGEWGSGKTSVMNMVAETLESNSDQITILRFNPWLFNGANDLVTLFFRELSAQLGQSKFWELKKVARVLAGLGQIVAPLSPVPGTREVVNLVGGRVEDWANQSSLRDKRKQLEEALKAAESRVVVLGDDVDRLESHETRDLMRLIRLMSDLPHVVFLLAFDRQRVAKSLDEDEAEGAKYLDKIVQLSYEVPVLRRAQLETILFASLDDVIRQFTLASLDKEVWQRIFLEVVRPLLRTMRDFKRYVNALPPTLQIIRDEVALADLLGLEAVRILRPRLFDAIKANVEHLVDPYLPSALGKPQEERDKESQSALNRELEKARDDREILKSVFDILFPVTHKHFGRGWLGPSPLSDWRAQRRVACEEVLLIYLQAGLDDRTLPNRVIKDLLEALTDEEYLAKLLDAFDDSDLEEAVDRLGDFKREFSIEAAPIAVPALMNRMGRLSADTPQILQVPPRSKLYFVVRTLVQKLTKMENSREEIDDVLHRVSLLSGRIVLIAMVGHHDRVGGKLVSQEHAADLENKLVHELHSATAQDLTDEWDLFGLISGIMRWIDNDRQNQLVTRLRMHLSADDFVLNLLRTSVTYAGFNGHVEKRLFWDELIEVFGEELSDSVSRLAESRKSDSLSTNDKDTLELAHRYASGWRPKAWHERL